MTMPRSRAVARVRPAEIDLPNEPVCEVQAQAIDRQTAAIDNLNETLGRILTEVSATRVAFKPAADAIHSLGDAQQKLCRFLVNNRLKLVAGTIAFLVAVGAISPNAAAVLSTFLKTVGVG